MDHLSLKIRRHKKSQILLSCALIFFLLAAAALIYHFGINKGYLDACGKAGCNHIYRSSQPIFFWTLFISYYFAGLIILFGAIIMLNRAIRLNPEERLSTPREHEPSNNSFQG